MLVIHLICSGVFETFNLFTLYLRLYHGILRLQALFVIILKFIYKVAYKTKSLTWYTLSITEGLYEVNIKFMIHYSLFIRVNEIIIRWKVSFKV